MNANEIDYNLLSQIYEYTKNNSNMLTSIMSNLNELTNGKEIEDKEEYALLILDHLFLIVDCFRVGFLLGTVIMY